MASLYNIINNQFPEFVQSDYPAFMEFVTSYYKWLEIQSIGKLEDIIGIDSSVVVLKLSLQFDSKNIILSQWVNQTILGSTGAKAHVKKVIAPTDDDPLVTLYVTCISAAQFTSSDIVTIEGSVGPIQGQLQSVSSLPSEFVQYFKRYLDVHGILSELAPYNTLYLKNIKQIYAAKGSEQGLVFLLRNVKSTDAVIRYPNENILRASNGLWLQDSIFSLINISGNNLPSTVSEIYQINQSSAVKISVNSFEVTNTTDNIETTVQIYHKFNPSLVISQGDLFEIRDELGHSIWQGRVISFPGHINVDVAGSNWQVGQIVTWPSNSTPTIARIADVSTTGAIKRVEIVAFGWGHSIDQQITVKPNPTSPDIDTATLTLKQTITAKTPGKWFDLTGQLSNQEVRLQDSFYYQQFSYDVESDVNPIYYKTLAKKVHPAGTKMFSTFALLSDIVVSPVMETSFPYKTLGVFDVIYSDDTDYNFSIVKPVDDLASPLDTVSKQFIKNGITDTVTLTAGSTVTITTEMYAAADYFAENYNKYIALVTIS